MTEFFIALFLIGVSHAFHVRSGLNLADEGSFWNGVLRTMQGEIPIRDFGAYDPGRYYWTWAWMKVFGSGILGLRHSLAVFQFLGLWAGLVAVSSATDSEWKLAAAGLICVLWMHPRHKLFEHALSLMAICMAVLVIQVPSPAMFFVAGVYTGFAGFMGRNHGSWTFAAIASLLLIMWFKGEVDNAGWLFVSWSAGIAIGYSPMLIMWAIIPGMAREYWDKMIVVYFFVKRGKDLPISIPWPWRDKYSQPKLQDRISRFLLGLHFLALPIFYVATLAWIVITPAAMEYPLLVASCLVGLFYAHHAGSRSDLAHLCQCIEPLFLGMFAVIFSLQNSLLEAFLLLALAVAGYFTTRQINPLIVRLESPEKFVEIDLHGDRLWVTQAQSRFLISMQELVAKNLQPDDSIFIAPVTPALYPILQQTTPVRRDYILHPETAQVQKETIQDLESNNVNWALIQDHPIDGRDELRFKNSHALLWDYFCTHFISSEIDGVDGNWRLLKRR